METASIFSVEMGLVTVVGRLGAAALLGLVIGFEREVRDRAAGLRTHMLVALAASTFAVLTFEIIERTELSADGIRTDPVRIIEAVTAGVAFLAAGSIIQARGRVRGLTTGAGLWLAGAIGLACGVGAFMVAAIATAMGMAVLVSLRWFESFLPKKAERDRAAEDDDGRDDGGR